MLKTASNIFVCRYDSPDEIVQFTDEVFQPEVQRAGLREGGEVCPGGLTEAAARNDRSVAHAMLLCANRRGINMLTKKRPDLIEVRIQFGMHDERDLSTCVHP